MQCEQNILDEKLFHLLTKNCSLSNDGEMEIFLVDIVDNQIETTHTKRLDRKKRDTDDLTETTLDPSVAEPDKNGSNDRIDRDVSSDVKREVRQLRHPPVGQTSWQYNNNYELTNVHHDPARDHGVNVNYNPFLVPPSSRSNQFFKNGGSNEFFHLSPFANAYTAGKSAQSNAVTEFNSHKPFTVHTSFELNDAPVQFHSNAKRPNKETSAPNDPFYPVVGQKPQTAGDNLPDNFSYYHIGNGGSKNAERDSFQPRPVQQPQQQPLRIAQPQAPIYYLNKPAKLLSASTPKNHYIQFSTVGGFFNNNPTAFSPIDNQKKPKLRLTTEKFDYVTHRPIYREPAPVPVRPATNLDDDSYYEIHDVDQPYVRPSAAHRPTSTPSSNPFYTKNVAGNVKTNEKDQSPKLYTYQVSHVTTEEIKIPLANKNKGFFITQNSKLSDGNLKVITTKPKFAQPAVTEKHHSTSKRPPGQGITGNKFIEDLRDSHRAQITKPKQIPLPNDFVRPNKLSTSTVKVETTSLADADDYYYYDIDEEIKTPTTKKRPNEDDQTTYRIDQRYKPTTKKTTITSTSAKVVPKEPIIPHPQNVQINQFELKPRPPKIQPLTQEYFVYDDDEEYDENVNDDGNEFKYKLPPVNVSKFMPMSETAAPRPAYLITTTSRPKLSSTTPKHTTSTYTKNYMPSDVPSFIQFPGDIFQAVHPNNNNNQSTHLPYTVRPRNKTTNSPSKTYTLKTKIPLTRTTTTPTTTSSSGKTYRPYTKTRGQDNRYTKAPKRPNSLKKHLWELDERLPNRY